MLLLWILTYHGLEPVSLPDMSSMDAVTRQLPPGLYTTFRTYGHRARVLGLRSHLQRLYHPCAMLGIRPVLSPGDLRVQLASLLSSFPADEARVRLMLASQDAAGVIHVAMEPLPSLPRSVYEQGVKVVTTQAHRDRPALKATSFIAESQRERRQVAEQSAFEGLIVHRGRILEGLTSNFFYFIKDTLGTARRGILNGVTRRQVLHLARRAGIPVSLVALPVGCLAEIDGAFLTSSSRGIVPIVSVDDVAIGYGGVGEGTRRLMEAYDADIDRRAEPVT